jgi:hypothetical protein
MDKIKRINWSLAVDILILLVLTLSVWPTKPVHAQLAASSGFNYNHISTAVNTQVSSGSVTLHNIMVNGGTAGVVTVVDTTAANCTGGVTIGIIAATTAQGQSYTYDLQTKNGLCITTAAATDLTVDFR